MYMAGANGRRADPAAAAAAVDSARSPAGHQHHQHPQQLQQQQPGIDCLVDDMRTELRREMDQLNKRIDQIDKHMSTILHMLQAAADAGVPSPCDVVGQRQTAGSVTDNDKKIIARAAAVQSPTFMDTISEQDEDTNSSAEAAGDDAGNGERQLKTVKTEREGGQQHQQQQLSKNSSGQVAQSSINDPHYIIQQDLDIF